MNLNLDQISEIQKFTNEGGKSVDSLVKYDDYSENFQSEEGSSIQNQNQDKKDVQSSIVEEDEDSMEDIINLERKILGDFTKL
jgi:hypothetical protein